MARFLSKLRVEHAENKDGRDDWTLTAALGYLSDLADPGYPGSGYLLEIWAPEGFTTDFSSVPRLPLMYLLAGDSAHAPSVIHDYLYRMWPYRDAGSRKLADAVFLEAMKVVGESAWRRWLMWGAVRIGGYWTWKRPGSYKGGT